MRICLTMGVGLLGAFAVSVAEARPWTSSDGKVIHAEFVELGSDGDSVVLDIEGRRFTVPLDRLSAEDQEYVEGLKHSRDPASAEDKQEPAEAESTAGQLRDRRIWKARDGTAVEARFIRLVSGTLLLREGSRYHRINFYDLSLADRQFLADAYAAIGKRELVPLVRPDLADPEPVDSPSESSDMRPPSPAPSSDPPPDRSSSPSSNSLTDSAADVQLPPSGFGSMGTNSEAEASTAKAPGSEVVLPPSGFGSMDEDLVDEDLAERSSPADAGTNLRLPETGFGSAAPSKGTADEQSETPADTELGHHVKIPQSTIVSDDLLPPSGFGAMPEEEMATTDDGFGDFGSAAQQLARNQPDAFASGPVASNALDPVTPPKRDTPRPRSQNSTLPPQAEFQPLSAPAPVELSAADWNLRLFAVGLLTIGTLLFASCYVWLVATAFLVSLQMGIRSLIPGMIILLGLTEFDNSNVPLIAMLLGACLTLGGCGLLLS